MHWFNEIHNVWLNKMKEAQKTSYRKMTVGINRYAIPFLNSWESLTFHLPTSRVTVLSCKQRAKKIASLSAEETWSEKVAHSLYSLSMLRIIPIFDKTFVSFKHLSTFGVWQKHPTRKKICRLAQPTFEMKKKISVTVLQSVWTSDFLRRR